MHTYTSLCVYRHRSIQYTCAIYLLQLIYTCIGFDRFPREPGPCPKSSGQRREYPGQNRETDRCWCTTDWITL